MKAGKLAEDDDEQSLASNVWNLDGDEPDDFMEVKGGEMDDMGFDPHTTSEGDDIDVGVVLVGAKESNEEQEVDVGAEDKVSKVVFPEPEPEPKAKPQPEPEPQPDPTPEPVASVSAHQTEPPKRQDSAKSKKKPSSKGGKRKSGKKKREVEDHSVVSAEEPPPAEAPMTAFRRTSVVRASPTKNNDWEGFSRKKELEEIDRAEKRAFYLKMKRDSGKMGSKAASALLGGGDDGDDVSLDSDDDWAEKLEGIDIEAVFAADPLDRKRKKVSVFQTLHAEDMESKYVGRRRGGEMREKVRGKSYLLKEAHLHEAGLAGGEREDEDEEVKEEEVKEEEVKEEVDVKSPEKVTLPPIV